MKSGFRKKLLNEMRPFSQSAIWQLQHDYFKENGINAWSTGEVPHYVTNNPMTGKVYAEIVFGFLRDLAAQGNTRDTVYILELGAGHGKFCYYFFKYFETLKEQLPVELPPFCYVLSDVAEANIDFWKTHPRLQPYLEKGWLDFAKVDATRVNELFLLQAGKTITAGSLRQPLVAIANYFFDTIPQELFYIENKKLHQSYVSIHMPEGAPGKNAAEILKAAQLQYENHPVVTPLYKEQFLNEILEDYTGKVSGAYLLYPDVGLRCIQDLKKLATKGLLLVTGDKGYHREENAALAYPPQLITHGSFSLSVNFNAFKKYCEGEERGKALFPKHLNFNLNVGCLFFMSDHDAYRETQLAYKRFVQDSGPDEFFGFKKIIERHTSTMNFREVISVLRISGYDPKFFKEVSPRLKELLTGITENERWTVFQAVHKIWDNYYPLGEEYDPAMEIGELLYLLHFFGEAVTYLKLSIKIHGESVVRLYCIALCYFSLGDIPNAMMYVEAILKADPEHEETLELLKHLKDNPLVPELEK